MFICHLGQKACGNGVLDVCWQLLDGCDGALK
jgi:hypothetical protein